MENLRKETAANFAAFSKAWQVELSSSIESLRKHEKQYRENYQRVTCIQAWRSELLEDSLDYDALAFLTEGQNDALTSHLLASMGVWRGALKSLRGCMENVLYCLYYKDHPVELQLWSQGKNRPTFSELRQYLISHPQLSGVSESCSGLDVMRHEYGELSRAVHGTGESFRMTADHGRVQLFLPDKARLGMWETRAKATLKAINLLLASFYREELKGNRLPNLRKVISFCIPSTMHDAIRSELGVSLFT